MKDVFLVTTDLSYNEQAALFDRVGQGQDASVAVIDKEQQIGLPKLARQMRLALLHPEQVLADLFEKKGRAGVVIGKDAQASTTDSTDDWAHLVKNELVGDVAPVRHRAIVAEICKQQCHHPH